MSLDVYLNRKRWISYDEGKSYEEDMDIVYSGNITHNLGKMAIKANIYDALWRPHRLKSDYKNEYNNEEELEFEKNCTTYAKDIITLLETGLTEMKERPDYYKQFNAPNGWGMYEHFLIFIEEYLNKCKEYPESVIEVSR